MPVQPQPGQMIGANVRLVSPLDEGGMGQVWTAEHMTLRSKVVVKFMSEELAATAEGRSRFSREAAAAARVRSPHVVQTLDHGLTTDGIPYIVLELLEGHDLGKHIELGGRMRPAELVQILSQLSRALSKVHECGIVHRDIKPSNIFLCDAGGGEVFVKLLDFGIAKSAQADDIAGPLAAKTSTGALVGTPFYMSPEQLAGTREVDHRTDLWSVGVVTFEALTGIKPFNAQSLASLAVQVMRDELPHPTTHDPTLPAAVDDWFAKACARDPGERFANVREMVDAFAAAFGEQTPAVVSASRLVSVRPPASRRDQESPLALSVSPNATTLHDDSRPGAATMPGARQQQATPRTGRLIGWGASLFVVGVLAALGVMKLTAHPDPGTNQGQGLAASAVASVPIVATSDSVAIASTPASEAPALPSASAAPERVPAATGNPSRQRDAAASAAATTAAPSATQAPAAATTAKKPPASHPGNEDDIK
jgi:eukaryotic-like serine/threonine-protein kinase